MKVIKVPSCVSKRKKKISQLSKPEYIGILLVFLYSSEEREEQSFPVYLRIAEPLAPFSFVRLAV